MKKEELAKCACGGEPRRLKLPSGKQMVKCRGCGKKTKAHGRKAEATKEWKEIANAAPAKEQAKKDSPKAEEKPQEKAQARPGKTDGPKFEGTLSLKLDALTLGVFAMMAHKIGDALYLIAASDKPHETAVKIGAILNAAGLKDGKPAPAKKAQKKSQKKGGK